jgi:hypothetical protein
MTSRVRIPPGEAPRLHVVIDTEEQFDWHAPYARTNTSVSAMRHIGRAQTIFDRFGIVPTYVVDYPVATQPAGYEPLVEIAARGGCAIGAHMHPWVNPPFDEAVSVANSFTCNLPPVLQRAKIATLRDAIAVHMAHPPRMFKAGRYGFDSTTVAVLDELGFEIDGSVCPQFDFSDQQGPSFATFDSSLFCLTSGLLEIPCTVDYTGWAGALRPVLHRAASSGALERVRAVGVLARLGAANRIMLSPEGNTLGEMQALTRALVARGCRHMTLSFHSPSVEPGHTPYVRSQQDLDQFLGTIEQYCEFFMKEIGGRPITSAGTRSWIQSFVEPIA